MSPPRQEDRPLSASERVKRFQEVFDRVRSALDAAGIE